MDELKSLFGEGALTYEEFESKLAENNIKLANLKSGMYVDKSKLDKANTNYSELQAKYNELVENTKTYDADKKELEAFRTEKTNRDYIDKIVGAKVDNKYAKFVLSEIKSSMGENDKFDDVLSKYVKDNPQYLTTRQGVFKFGSSSPDLENGKGTETKTINQTMNEIIRNRGEN